MSVRRLGCREYRLVKWLDLHHLPCLEALGLLRRYDERVGPDHGGDHARALAVKGRNGESGCVCLELGAQEVHPARLYPYVLREPGGKRPAEERCSAGHLQERGPDELLEYDHRGYRVPGKAGDRKRTRLNA